MLPANPPLPRNRNLPLYAGGLGRASSKLTLLGPGLVVVTKPVMSQKAAIAGGPGTAAIALAVTIVVPAGATAEIAPTLHATVTADAGRGRLSAAASSNPRAEIPVPPKYRSMLPPRPRAGRPRKRIGREKDSLAPKSPITSKR